MDQTKQALIEKLKEERDQLSAKGVPVVDHDLTILYINNGTKPANWRNYDRLSTAIQDMDSLYDDYNIKR